MTSHDSTSYHMELSIHVSGYLLIKCGQVASLMGRFVCCVCFGQEYHLPLGPRPLVRMYSLGGCVGRGREGRGYYGQMSTFKRDRGGCRHLK